MTTISSVNDWADFWRYQIGVNVIPANTRNKTPTVNWKQYQNIPILEEQHNKWKQEDVFKEGMAIIAGKIWHNYVKAKENLYLICIDCDNQKAVDEICTRNGVMTPLRELSKYMIVEQHKDAPNKAHFIFYATHPFPRKSSDVVSALAAKLDHNEVPAIEVKGAGEHGILFVTPSPHKNGLNYEIIEGCTMGPEIVDQLQDHLQEICKKYGIPYGNNGIANTGGNVLDDNGKIPIQDLFKPDTKVVEGHNRHEALLRVMESLIKRNQNILDEYKIRELAEDWNKDHCQSPLTKREFEKQWNGAKDFIEKHNKRHAFEQQQYKERLAREALEEELHDSVERKLEQKNPLSVHVLARLNEEGKTHYGAGQLTSLGMLYKRVRAAEIKCIKCGSHRTDVFLHPETKQYFADHYILMSIEECQYIFGTTCNGKIKITPEYVSAVDIEVSDPGSLQDLDRLRYILFGDDTKDVGIGENATILGTIYMETPKKNGPTFPVAYTQSLKYEDREQQELTRFDIEGIKRFRNKFFPDDQQLINQLVKMTACNIFGHDTIKEGILYMVTNAKQDKRDRRERIHGIIISNPGRAKTALLMYATKLMTRSTFETAQMSTGLSLLLIVENTGEMKVIRLGPVPISLLACIDEFNKLTNTDQEKFYGIMQEGFFTSNKFGRKQRVTAPTTILSSINPPEGSRSATPDSDGRIDLTDMNIIRPIWDRFDLKFYIPPMKGEDEIRKLANAKADQEGREIPDYSRFLKKYFIYAKQIIPTVQVTDDAKSILVEAYIEMARNNSVISPRRQEVLFNLTKARARALLRNVANGEDAKAIVEWFAKMIKDYETGTIAPKDPIEMGVKECMRILSESVLGKPVPYTVKELFLKMCEQ